MFFMKNFNFLWAMTIPILLACNCAGVKKSVNATPFRNLTPLEKNELTQDIVDKLRRNYVDEKTIQANQEILQTQLSSSLERDFESAEQLANTLTDTLRDVIKDKHMGVWPERPKRSHEQEQEEQTKWIKEHHYGVGKVQVDNDIGYLELTAFGWPRGSEEMLKKYVGEAFAKLNHAKAIIIDLRKNGGGSPEMVATIFSFIVPAKIKLNEFHWRDPDGIHYERINNWPPLFDPDLASVTRTSHGYTVEKFQTIDEEKNFGFKSNLKNVPVAVLVSKGTFSAAEEFAYNLKQLKRGLVIGEQTAGGANPWNSFPLKFGFEIGIPNGEAKNAITKDNWEKKGVEPDVKVPSEDAVAEATAILSKMI